MYYLAQNMLKCFSTTICFDARYFYFIPNLYKINI